MEIKTTYAGLDLAVEPSSDNVDNENACEVLIGSQLITTTKQDYIKLDGVY